MGGCCTCQRVRIERYDGYRVENANYREEREVEDDEYNDHGIVGIATFGAHVRLHGSSKYVSMFSQQGKKGINQDAMTVWEVNFLHPHNFQILIMNQKPCPFPNRLLLLLFMFRTLEGRKVGTSAVFLTGMDPPAIRWRVTSAMCCRQRFPCH